MSDIRRFGDMMGKYVGAIDPQGKRFQARAIEAWHAIAGEEVRKHTRGLALRDGQLLIHVDAPAWATELSVMAEYFRVEINEKLGEELVRSVRFDVSRRVKREAEREAAERADDAFYDPDPVRPIPLTEGERRQVEFCMAGITDQAVRDAAIRAMTKDLEWKKGIRLRNEPQSASEGPEKGG